MAMIPQAGKRDIDVGKWLTEAFQRTFDPRYIGVNLLVGLVATLLLFVASMTVIGPLFVQFPILCGLFFYAQKRLKEQPAEMGDLFKGFDVFVQGLIASLLVLVALIVLFPVMLVIALIFSCCLPIAGFVFWIFLYLIFVGIVPALLYDRQMGAIDAFKINWGFLIPNFGPLLLYSLVITGLQAMASMPFLLGLIVVLPFTGFAIAVQYRDLIGFASDASARYEDESMAMDKIEPDEE